MTVGGSGIVHSTGAGSGGGRAGDRLWEVG